MKRGSLWKALIASVALVAAGCGAVSPSTTAPASKAPVQAPSSANAAQSQKSAPPASAPKLQTVKLMFPFTPGPDWGPYLLAAKRGYYRAEGLHVVFLPGKGASGVIQQVVTGHVQFAHDSQDVAAIARSKGEPVISIAGVLRKNLFGIFVPKNGPIHTFRELEGHTLLVSPGDPAVTLYLPMLAKLQGLQVNKIHLDSVSAQTKVGLYLSGKGNAMDTGVPHFLPIIEPKRPSRVLLFASAGIDEPSDGLITSANLAKQHPGLVRRFVAASMKGWQQALSSTSAAKEGEQALVEAYPTLKLGQLMASWKVYKQFVNTPNTVGHPIGWQSPKDWQDAIHLLNEVGALKGTTNPAHYYTDRFLPKS